MFAESYAKRFYDNGLKILLSEEDQLGHRIWIAQKGLKQLHSDNKQEIRMSSTEDFMDLFNSKQFENAQKAFDNLNDEAKQIILAHLFQASQCKKMPSSVSVLFRRLHNGKEFSDFYNAWLPPKEKCTPEMVDGYVYQNFFDGPIRVINAINFEDQNEIVSIGLHWISDKDLHDALNNPKIKKDGDERGDNIKQVAEKVKAGIYKVVKDDNLGTPF